MTFLFVLFFSFNSMVEAYEDADQAILMSVKDYKNHPVIRNHEKRRKIARIAVNSSLKTGIPWALTVSVMRFESSFIPERVSTDGRRSKGLMHAHGAAIRYCRKIEGRRINMKTLRDQTICGCNWLKFSIDQCAGNFRKGLTKYVTGYTCKYKQSKSLRFVVSRRMQLFNKIRYIVK